LPDGTRKREIVRCRGNLGLGLRQTDGTGDADEPIQRPTGRTAIRLLFRAET
jgi:hypothetical protein